MKTIDRILGATGSGSNGGRPLVREWIEQFKEKHNDYRQTGAFDFSGILGERGEFAQIWKKVGKLYKGMWLGEKLDGEQPRELLMDLVGHCFLAIAAIDARAERERENFDEDDEVDIEKEMKHSNSPMPYYCGAECTNGHTVVGAFCALRLMGPKVRELYANRRPVIAPNLDTLTLGRLTPVDPKMAIRQEGP